MALFADEYTDFDGLDTWESVEYYQHDANWSNRMVLGDSLRVLASLAEKEGMRGKVQMIYLDPPYGIRFGSNWQNSMKKRDVRDGNLADVTREVEQIKAFRDTWELGINSYLAYLRDRLVVARDLLTDSGSIFVQIGDENVHLVRSLLDEVFGPENFFLMITFQKTSSSTSDFGGTADYVLWYAKEISLLRLKRRALFIPKRAGGSGAGEYNLVELADGRRLTVSEAEKHDVNGRLFRYDNLTSQSMGRAKGEGAASWFPVEIDGKNHHPHRAESVEDQRGWHGSANRRQPCTMRKKTRSHMYGTLMTFPPWLSATSGPILLSQEDPARKSMS